MRGALRTAALGLGCVEIQGEAAIVRASQSLQVILPDGAHVQPDAVIIASGAWSTSLVSVTGQRIPVVPQRGQIAHFLWKDDSTSSWPSVETESRFYMLAFADGRVVSGATRELESGFDPRLTASGMHEVLTQALRIAPGLADTTVAEFRVGLRPFSPDGRPFIGSIPGTTNGWICTGHGPSGLTLGPLSGEVLAGMINGEPPVIDMHPYAIGSARGVST
jgi:D-amino-acid dehydrogenase